MVQPDRRWHFVQPTEGEVCPGESACPGHHDGGLLSQLRDDEECHWQNVL
jgi:hypothetical protein